MSREGERELEKKKKRGRDCTHGPELHAWSSPSAVPVNGDPSERERERGDGAGGREESGGWFTGRRLALEN